MLKAHLMSLSASSLFLAFDFIFNNVENPFSHDEFVDENGKSTRNANRPIFGYCDDIAAQKSDMCSSYLNKSFIDVLFTKLRNSFSISSGISSTLIINGFLAILICMLSVFISRK